VARAARILVVDDNETLRTLIAQVLEAEGYVAIAADSAEEALEVARFAPPDLFLVDHVMPGMTGAELIRALHASSDEKLRRIPAIGLSAYDRGRHELLAAGAVAAIGKPVAYALLLDEVQRTLAASWWPGKQAPA
jgi:CheY-like chemotaxis protein